MYSVIDAALLRIAAHPDRAPTRGWPDLVAGTVPGWRDWLHSVWSDTAFVDAVTTASPSLAQRVGDICCGREQRTRQVRSAVESVIRYRLRACTRATPFGRFAGIAPAATGGPATVRIGSGHRVTARADAAQLHELVAELEQCPEVAAQLPVVLNNAAIVRDGRLVIALRQALGPASSQQDPAEVSLRFTAAIERVVQLAQTPIRLADLAGHLAAAYPDTASPAITGMLRQLLAQRVLISSVRAPMTVTDPVAHVRAALNDAHADDLPAAATLLNGACPPGRPRSCRAVDLRVDAEIVLPDTVLTDATRAANALARLTQHPFGTPAWVDYHSRFLERYGIGAAVPLLELTNPDLGLGFPAGYRDSLFDRPEPRRSDRDAALLRLAHAAALNRQVAVDLDDTTIEHLQAADVGRAQFPPHTELAIRIHAPTLAALNRGDYDLAVTGSFRAAGTTTGRFLDLLDPAERERFARAYTHLPTLNAGALRVQVSCPPLYTDTENVARSPQLFPDVLSLGEHRPAATGVLTPQDLLVVGDSHRMYLWSRSRARPVEPEVFSAVELTTFAHPLLRFLCEITTARAAVSRPFSWGAAGELPFLPRLTHGRAILAPARWTLTTSDLPDKAAAWSEWTAALRRWREQMMVPAAVYLGGNDQRVLLDLHEPAHRYLLRAHLNRYPQATLLEGPAPGDFGWINGHAHEIVLPLATTQPRVWPPIPTHRAPLTATTAHDADLPGAGHWLFCKLYGHPGRHDTVLTQHLPNLLGALDKSEQWWFLPYRDPEHHLRLRIRLTATHGYGDLAARVGAWAAQLRDAGLLTTLQLDTYRPEHGRFGHGPVMRLAEQVFAADSAAALAQRTHLTGPHAVDRRALIAASLCDIAAAFTGDHATGAAWLTGNLTTDPMPAPDRATYEKALHLADPHTDAVRSLPHGESIARAWQRRRTALGAYRDMLATAGEPTPDSVLASLLHLHCIRTTGLDPSLERICHRLARSAAVSQTARPKTLV